MDEQTFREIIKKHFQKYGLSKEAQGEIFNLLAGSVSETTTEAEAVELASKYEPMARVYQSDLDARVTQATEKVKKGLQSKEEGDNNPVLLQVQELITKISDLEKKEVLKTNTQRVTAELKKLNLSEKEIEANIYGRTFETQEQIDEYITKQSELYADITKERLETLAGGGIVPLSGGSSIASQVKNDIDKFNENH